MDTKLLLELLKIPAISGKEDEMKNFITLYLSSIGIDYKLDELDNIYSISHKNEPLLSAHIDTVQDESDIKLLKYIKKKKNIISGYGVIGGDDKCGIFIILELLKTKQDVNFVFFTGEESGAIGSSFFTNNNDLKDILYGLVLDRRGSNDIICSDISNEYGVKEFENTLISIGEAYGYKDTSGTFSDADNLSDKISCANLSVGYYNAHTKYECINLQHLNNALNFIHSIIKHLDTKFEAPDRLYNYGAYNYGGYYNNYSIKGMCLICDIKKSNLVYLKTLKDSICKKCMIKLTEELDEKIYYFENESDFEEYGNYY